MYYKLIAQYTYSAGPAILAGIGATLISLILAAGSHVARRAETPVSTYTIINTCGTILA